jgi:hypothetical protein
MTFEDTLVFNTIRGKMMAVTGKTWKITEQFSTIEWEAPTPIDASKLDSIKAAL